MRTATLRFRLIAAIAAASMLSASMPVHAQQEGGQPIDPPERVGRIARTVGSVSYHGAGATDWEPADLNLPVTAGSGLWTEPGARAEIDLGGARAVIDGGSQFEIETLNEHTVLATEGQGSVALRVDAMQAGDTLTVRTPRGTVTIGTPGGYVITAGDTDHPTEVTALDGQAQVAGPGVSNLVGPHQTLTISGTDSFTAALGPERVPDFARTAVMPQPMVAGPDAPPPIVRHMTGGEALYDTGTWEPSPQYGQVWYPPVQAGWVPYREGHWAWIEPWGWTWVDDAPWGFAPFHYGRWVEIGPRWAWVPVMPGVAVVSYPVYAPALVAFVGFTAGVVIGSMLSRPVGWVPLGPREAYHPPYRVSNTYLRQVNITHVTNVTNITNVTNVNTYINHRAATVVPATAMTGSRSIARVARPIPAANLAAARPVREAPVMPTRATAGVTQRTAQQLNLPPALPAARPRPVAPGPAIPPPAQPGRSTIGPAPALVRPGAPQAGRPVAPAPVPAPRPAAPGLPALRPVAPPPGGIRPGQPQPGQPRPGEPRPGQLPQQGAPRPGLPQVQGPRPAPNAPQLQAPRPAPAAPQVQAPRPAPTAPQLQAPRPAPAAPQLQAPRPAPAVPQVQAPRPAPTAPQLQAPRPAPAAPQLQAPRPAPVAPQLQAPRPVPQPQIQAPRPPSPPQFQAPRPQPQPQFQAPRPQPQPQFQAPRPQPQPQPQFQAPRPQPQQQQQRRVCPPGHPNC